MIVAVCVVAATLVCAPAATTNDATEGVLTVHAERVEARAFMHEVARARQLVTWVDAIVAVPAPTGPRADSPAGMARPAPPAPTATDGTVNGYPCGGNLPPCTVLRCESGGNPNAENPTSTASGLWQIIDGTWNGYGGYTHAADAPPDIQNQKAADLYAGGAGGGHWAQCR